MGSSTTDLFLALLRNALFGASLDSASVPPVPDWKGLMALANKQTLMGLVFDAVSRLPEACQPPQEISEEMFRQTLRVMQTHTLLDSTLAETVEFYRRHGIGGVLLKGQGIARCYPNPQLRQCGDIDFYVGEKNYPESVDLALKELCRTEGKTSESEKHFNFSRGSVTVELHRVAALMQTPWRKEKFAEWLKSELDNPLRLRQLEFNGTMVNVPSPDFDVLFIFYHAWHHFSRSGIGLRQLCDWMVALHRHKGEIDKERLGKFLKTFGLMKPWQIFGCIAVGYLGLPEKELPFHNAKQSGKAAKAMKKIMSDGNFGFHDPRRRNCMQEGLPLLRRKWLILRQVVKSYTQTFPIIPVESTCYLVKLVFQGGVHTVKQLLAKAKGKDGEGN